MMRLSQGTRVLDVGTRGGAVGVAAATTVGTQGVFWKQFTDTASERLYKNFGSLLKFTTTVNLAVGVKQKI